MKLCKFNIGVLCVLFAASFVMFASVSSEASAQGRTESKAPAVDDDDDEDEDETEASADEVSEGGEKVKVYRFSGLDISGRLKSPQLLYFLNRLRAEFDRPRLPHRSFIKEMVRSTKGRAF